jgi:hypothetical protein
MHVNRISANYDVAAAPSHRNKHADAAAAAPTCTQLLCDSRGRVMQESPAHDAVMPSAVISITLFGDINSHIMID